MADQLPPRVARSDEDGGPEDDTRPPRWVIVFGIVAAVLVVAFIVLHLAGGGFRGHG